MPKSMVNTLKHLRSLELIDYYCSIFGKARACINPKLSIKPKSILFVCLGNICRSAYARKKFAVLIKNTSISFITLDSAGLETKEGKKADDFAIRIAKRRGLDLNPHRTKSATLERLESADLILIMDSSHYKQIDEKNRTKVKFLGCFGNQSRISIKDPYGKSEEVFLQCFDQIDQALEGLLTELQKSV